MPTTERKDKHMPAFPLVCLSGRVMVSLLGIFLVFSWMACASVADARNTKSQSDDRTSARTRIVKAKERKPVAYKKRAKKTRAVRKKQVLANRRPARKVVQAKAFYCIDLKRNHILMARNPDKRLPVASLTKLVTALVTLEHMPLKRKLIVPDHIRKVPKSVVGLKPGDRISVEELLHGLLISSGNDCAETLACAYPGGKARFVRAMNQKAKSLGATSTFFYTPSGLDWKVAGKKDGEVHSNLSTARDISRIARVAFSNAKIRSICRKKAHVLPSAKSRRGYAVRTTNKLLRDNLPVIGGKTGYTSRAGHCLATELAPSRKDVFLIVVLGSPNHFRDTRLVYRKALAETRKTGRAVSVKRRVPRIAAHSLRFLEMQ